MFELARLSVPFKIARLSVQVTKDSKPCRSQARFHWGSARSAEGGLAFLNQGSGFLTFISAPHAANDICLQRASTWSEPAGQVEELVSQAQKLELILLIPKLSQNTTHFKLISAKSIPRGYGFQGPWSHEASARLVGAWATKSLSGASTSKRSLASGYSEHVGVLEGGAVPMSVAEDRHHSEAVRERSPATFFSAFRSTWSTLSAYALDICPGFLMRAFSFKLAGPRL